MGAPRKEENRAVLLARFDEPKLAEVMRDVGAERAAAERKDPRPTHLRIVSDTSSAYRGRIGKVRRWDLRDAVIILADGTRRIVYSDEWAAASEEERAAYEREARVVREREAKAKPLKEEVKVETRDVFLLVQEALASLVHPTEIHTRSEVDLVASRHKLRIAISSLEFEVERIDRQMQKRTELLSP